MRTFDGFIEELNAEQLIWFNVSHCEVEECTIEVEEGAIRWLFIDEKVSYLRTNGDTVLAGINCLKAVAKSNRLWSSSVVKHFHWNVVFNFLAQICQHLLDPLRKSLLKLQELVDLIKKIRHHVGLFRATFFFKTDSYLLDSYKFVLFDASCSWILSMFLNVFISLSYLDFLICILSESFWAFDDDFSPIIDTSFIGHISGVSFMRSRELIFWANIRHQH